MVHGFQTHTVAGILGGNDLTGDASAQGSLEGVGHLEEYGAGFFFAPDGDFTIACGDFPAGFHGVFQQIAQHHRKGSFRQPDDFRQLDELSAEGTTLDTEALYDSVQAKELLTLAKNVLDQYITIPIEDGKARADDLKAGLYLVWQRFAPQLPHGDRLVVLR